VAWQKGIAVAAAALLIVVGGTVGFSSELRTTIADKFLGNDRPPVDIADKPNVGKGVNPGIGTGTSTGNNGIGILVEPDEDVSDVTLPAEGNASQPEVVDPPEPGGEQIMVATVDTPDGGTVNSGTNLNPTRVLLNDNAKVAVSTQLRVATTDVNLGKSQASAFAAAGPGVTLQNLPEQKDSEGKTTVLIKLTVPSEAAQGLIANLSGLGDVVSNSDEKRNITTSYNDTSVLYNDLQKRLEAQTDQGERQKIEAQLASYEKQFKAWDEEVSKQTISLWLIEK
jgi:hypothetical protein